MQVRRVGDRGVSGFPGGFGPGGGHDEKSVAIGHSLLGHVLLRYRQRSEHRVGRFERPLRRGTQKSRMLFGTIAIRSNESMLMCLCSRRLFVV